MHDARELVRRRLAEIAVDPDSIPALADELVQHVEDRYRASLSAGLDETMARAAACRELDGCERFAAEYRALAPLHSNPVAIAEPKDGWWAGCSQDARHALRTLRRSPGFTITALVTVALTTGPTMMALGVTNWLFFRPPTGVAEPSRLGVVWFGSWAEGGFSPSRISYAQLADIRTGLTAIAGIAGEHSDVGQPFPRVVGRRAPDRHRPVHHDQLLRCPRHTGRRRAWLSRGRGSRLRRRVGHCAGIRAGTSPLSRSIGNRQHRSRQQSPAHGRRHCRPRLRGHRNGASGVGLAAWTVGAAGDAPRAKPMGLWPRSRAVLQLRDSAPAGRVVRARRCRAARRGPQPGGWRYAGGQAVSVDRAAVVHRPGDRSAGARTDGTLLPPARGRRPAAGSGGRGQPRQPLPLSRHATRARSRAAASARRVCGAARATPHARRPHRRWRRCGGGLARGRRSTIVRRGCNRSHGGSYRHGRRLANDGRRRGACTRCRRRSCGGARPVGDPRRRAGGGSGLWRSPGDEARLEAEDGVGRRPVRAVPDAAGRRFVVHRDVATNQKRQSGIRHPARVDVQFRDARTGLHGRSHAGVLSHPDRQPVSHARRRCG